MKGSRQLSPTRVALRLGLLLTVCLAALILVRWQGSQATGVLGLPGPILRPAAALGRGLGLELAGLRPIHWPAILVPGVILGVILGVIRRRLPAVLAAFLLGATGQLLLLRKLYPAGVVCWCGAALCLFLVPWSIPEREERHSSAPWLWIAASLVGLTAFWLRLYNLGTYTPDPFTWAMENTAGLMDVIQRGWPALMTRRTWGLGLLTTSCDSLLYGAAIWGATRLAGFHVAAFRAVSALAGILDVYLIYRFARLDGRRRRTAILAAALLATMAHHLYFSRAGYYTAFTGTAVLAALVLTRAAIRHRRPLTYLGLGLLLGLLPHLYAPARVYVLILPLFLVGPILLGPRRRSALAGLLLVAAGIFAAIWPIVDDPPRARRDFFQARGEQVMAMVQDPHFMQVYLQRELPPPPYPPELKAEAAWRIFSSNVAVLVPAMFGLRKVAGFGTALDMDGSFVGPFLGLAALLGIGLGLATWRPRDERGSLLWYWGLALGLGPSLLTNQVNPSRIHHAAALMAYGGALALGRLWDELEGRQAWGRWAAALVVITGVVGIDLTETGRFFMPPGGARIRLLPATMAQRGEALIRRGRHRLYFFVDDVHQMTQSWLKLRLSELTEETLGGELILVNSVYEVVDSVQTGRWPTEGADALFTMTPEVEQAILVPLVDRIKPGHFIPGPPGPKSALQIPAEWLLDVPPAKRPLGQWLTGEDQDVYYVDMQPVATMHDGEVPWASRPRYWYGLPKGELHWGGTRFFVPREAPALVLHSPHFDYDRMPREADLPIPGLGRADGIALLGLVAAWGGAPEDEKPSMLMEVEYLEGEPDLIPFLLPDTWAHLRAQRDPGPEYVKVADTWGIHLNSRIVPLDGSREIRSVRILDGPTDASPLVVAATFLRSPAP